MQRALASLPWVDQGRIEINNDKQVRLTIKDMKEYDEKALIAAFKTEFDGASVLKKPS